MERDDAWKLTDRLHAGTGKGDPFAAAVRGTRMPMIVTDPRQDDNPIVFVNDAFLRMTGHARDEVMGRNCRFLQGPETDAGAVAEIREAIAGKRDVSIDILNYRRDGTPFWNALYISPVSNEAGEVLYFFASQVDVTDRVDAHLKTQAEKEHVEREVARRTRELSEALAAKTMLLHEVDHRVKNNLQMISSLLALQTRTIADPAARAAMEGMLKRVEALGTVQRRLYQSDAIERFDVTACARDLAADLVRGLRRDVRLAFDARTVEVPVAKASPIALILNEVITNALRHGFPDGRPGRLSIAIVPDGTAFSIRIADDGVGMPAAGDGTGEPTGKGDPGRGTFGRRLIETLARQLDAGVSWRTSDPGTAVEITLPRGTAFESET